MSATHIFTLILLGWVLIIPFDVNSVNHIVTVDRSPAELRNSSMKVNSAMCYIVALWKRNPDNTELALVAHTGLKEASNVAQIARRPKLFSISHRCTVCTFCERKYDEEEYNAHNARKRERKCFSSTIHLLL